MVSCMPRVHCLDEMVAVIVLSIRLTDVSQEDPEATLGAMVVAR